MNVCVVVFVYETVFMHTTIFPFVIHIPPHSQKALIALITSHGGKRFNRVKIQFVGAGRGGKTSLIQCLLNDRPVKPGQVQPSTVGTEFHDFEVTLAETKAQGGGTWTVSEVYIHM